MHKNSLAVHLRKIAILTVIVLVSHVFAASAWAAEPDTRPNFLLIVADDLGYADLGVYGSSIRTPNIDALADQGMRFTSFHTSPMCSPTRSMLLSGNNNHVAGVGRQSPYEPLRDDQAGYEGYLSDRIVPLPRVLQAAGYHTYMAGKWDLGTEQEHSPKVAGFERSFGLIDGAANHFDGRGLENAASIYREDGQLIDWPDGAYSTALYTDKLIEFIGSNQDDGKPFFAYAAYTSPHWPLQVPNDERNRYAGQYEQGYDALRKENFEALKTANILAANATLPPRNPAVLPWDELSPELQQQESRKMELYAAMVANLDDHVGRLIGYLKNQGLYENTLIVFMSDNGAAGNDFYNDGPYVDYIREHHPAPFEAWGGPDSFVSYAIPWAEAGSAPFKRYKGFSTEGGIVAALIIAGPSVAAADQINRSYLTVMDLAPTLIELAGAHYPDDGSVQPMRGSSLLPLLRGEVDTVHSADYVTTLFHRNMAFVRQGPWKLTAIDTPFEEKHFQLYNLDTDLGETTDLSRQYPEKREKLLELWRRERLELGIVVPQDL